MNLPHTAGQQTRATELISEHRLIPEHPEYKAPDQD